jgi:hypothetical protein
MKPGSEQKPIRKKHRRWLVYLSAAGIALFAIWAGAVAIAYDVSREASTGTRVVAMLIPTVVALAFVLVALLGDKIFSWRYSVLGPYERSPPPKDFHPRITMSFDLPDLQGATRYEVGAEGIEITYGNSRVFIPASAIRDIVPMGLRMYDIHHDSPETESPLNVRQEVAEALLAGLGRTAAPE